MSQGREFHKLGATTEKACSCYQTHHFTQKASPDYLEVSRHMQEAGSPSGISMIVFKTLKLTFICAEFGMQSLAFPGWAQDTEGYLRGGNPSGGNTMHCWSLKALKTRGRGCIIEELRLLQHIVFPLLGSPL